MIVCPQIWIFEEDIVGQKAETRTIYIMSDASGARAAYLVEGALEQFRGISTIERRFPDVDTESKIARIMHAAEQIGAIVIYTFGDESRRATAKAAAEQRGVIYVDLFDPLMSKLGQWFGEKPLNRPGHVYDEKYFARMAAFDFATSHDDGKRPEELTRADIVVLGVSRASKSPVCRQLAEHRLLAANVPIVPGVELPAQLEEVDPRRVYVLEIRLDRLLAVRESRRLGGLSLGADDPYVDRRCVKAEILRVNILLEQQKHWTPINVTHRAVEETAAIIMSAHQKRFP
ncbi:MAG: pyruvate, phosphate dikinase/phosphoenolpyruvate synthase regulator [bacterium]|nr:pyruvate, phosphate dikinase/phosphoenolpyruvate synthase regulator [bacterium]